MSGECSFFNFCLRGRDSLVSKWISQKRKIPETLKTDGANIYAISEYIHTVFYFDKLYGSDYSCNVLFNKIIAINELDKNHIVKFDEIIKIPFDFTPYEFTERSFDDMAKDVSGAEFSAVTLGSVLSDSEIKELLINIYHINYDLRENENIKNKTYDEIISGRFIEFKDKSSLSFFIPYIFEISAQKVAESSKATVEVSLATSSIQPELSNTTVEGYFYTVDGDYAGKNGNSEDCYVLNEEVEISKNLDGAEYTNSQVTKLEITHEQFNQICGVIYDEDSDSFDIMAALTQTSFNAVNLSKPGIQLLEKSKYVANLLFNTNYSTVRTKRRLKDTDKTDKQKLMRKALIHVLQGGRDYSNGGVRWDGVDFVTRGVNHPKAKGEGGISITKILWDDLIENWFPTSDSCFEYPTGISNTKDSCANNIPFLKANSTDIERQIQAQQIKNDCSNLWQVTETLLETEGTGKFNKGNILNKATAVIGKTIFWGTNNTDPKNKGYSWKYLLTSGWFKL